MLKILKKKQSDGDKQQQLSKEFVREWLIENNFMGRPVDKIPFMSAEWVEEISDKYISIYELLTSKIFTKSILTNEEMYSKISEALRLISLQI